MLSPDVEVTEIDAAGWGRLLRLARLAAPDSGEEPAASPATAPVILFLRAGRPIQGARLGGGAIAAGEIPWHGLHALSRTRHALGAPLLLAMEEGVLPAALAEAQLAIRHDDDFVAQGLALVAALRAHLGRGLYLDPDPLAGLPLPSYGALQRTLDGLFPDGSAVALFVLDRGQLFASLIAAKEGGDIVRITTHDALPPLPLGLDLTRAHRHLREAVERQITRASCVATLDRQTWRRLDRGGPGALARALATGDVVIDPIPAWLVALVGAGAAFGAAQRGARLLGRFVPASFRQAASGIGDRVSGSLSPFAALGFDPIELWRRLQPLLRTSSRDQHYPQ